MTRARSSTDPAAHLGAGLAAQLPLAPPRVRALVEKLLAPSAAARIGGLDAVQGALLPEGSIAEDAHETLPFVVALATAPRYPEAARLLVRLASFLSAIDDPPRRLAGAGGTELARRAYDVIGARAPALVGVARSSSNPEAARLAAVIAAHFPDADAEVGPLLVALLSGAKEPVERARLLYALARVQATRGHAFQGRIAEALQGPDESAEKLAVSMALAEHDPPEPLRSRVTATLRAALEDPSRHRDPTTWGDRLSTRRVERLIARIGGGAG